MDRRVRRTATADDDPPRSGVSAFGAAVGAANLADGALLAVLPLAALGAGAGPIGLAAVSTATLLPWLLASLPAGVLVDRMSSTAWLSLGGLVRAGLLVGAAILAAADLLPVPALLALALALGVLETVQDTAIQSFTPWLVPDAELERTNGRLATVQLTGNQLLGPALGGLIAAARLWLALGLCAVLYLLAAACLRRVPPFTRPPAPSVGMGRAIGEGVGFLWRDRPLRSAAAMVAALNLAGAASMAILALYAVRPGPLGLSRGGFGLLLASAGAGGVLGAGLAHRVIARARPGTILVSTIGLLALAAAGPGISTSPVAVSGLLFVAGLVAPLWSVLVISFRQRRVPRALLGRVNAAFQLVGTGAAPCGALAGGSLAAAIGLRATFLVAGGVALLALLGVRSVRAGVAA